MRLMDFWTQIETIGVVFVVLLAYFSLVFVLAWIKKRLDIVDIAWGGAFILAAVTGLFLGKPAVLQWIVASLVVIWALRLSGSIFVRFAKSKSEDFRYIEMRRKWKQNVAMNAYLRIFVVQAFLATVISLSTIYITVANTTTLSTAVFLGLGIWLVGFLFEAVGDFQLRRHVADPKNKGKLLTSGLWRYTRHPNYFGEATVWWGVFVIALSVPYGWITVIAPLTITFLLLFVSGVPLTEKKFEGVPGWEEYKKRTSAFFPLPPRS